MPSNLFMFLKQFVVVQEKKKKKVEEDEVEDAVTKELHKKKAPKFDPCTPLDKIAHPIDAFE